MSELMDLVAWARAVDEQVRPRLGEIHPAGATTIHEWLAELREADDPAEVARLSSAIARKLALEQQWAAAGARP